MNTSYKELVEQRKALDLQIQEARQKEVGAAVEKVRELVQQFDLKAADVFPASRGSGGRNKGSTVAVKYRDPVSGGTWTGRGKPPNWIKDQDREKFLINK